MNKETFIIQLEKLLDDIPKEERDEAVDYYRCYFDDAGVAGDCGQYQRGAECRRKYVFLFEESAPGA